MSRRHFARSASLVSVISLGFATPALAEFFGEGTITGNDASSVYDCPTGTAGTSDCYGTLTFDDGTAGIVDLDTFGNTLVGMAVEVELKLAPFTNQGIPQPYDPVGTSLNRARLLGANEGTGLNGQNASDLRIVDPGSGNVVLAWDIKYIDVAGFTFPGGPDTDGSITLGNPDEQFFDARRGSHLTLVGGTLNQTFFDGVTGIDNGAGDTAIGSHAVLMIQMAALAPIFANKVTYLGNPFTAGPGPANIFQMTITHNPEPATAALLGMGMLGLVTAARRRARRR